MNGPQKETTVERYFVATLKEAFPEAQVHKYEVRRSEPDRLCLLPGGRAVFVELKRPKKTLRPEQARAAQRLQDLGFEVYWANTQETAAQLIEFLKTSG